MSDNSIASLELAEVRNTPITKLRLSKLKRLIRGAISSGGEKNEHWLWFLKLFDLVFKIV